MDIHQRIKARRIELGMSMQTLAKEAGLKGWQSVQQWEKPDGTAPRRAILQRVADALRVTPEWLLFGPQDGQENHTAAAPNEPLGSDLRALQVAEIHKIVDALNIGELATCLGWLFQQYGERVKRGENQDSEKVNPRTQSGHGNISTSPASDGGNVKPLGPEMDTRDFPGPKQPSGVRGRGRKGKGSEPGKVQN